MKLRPAFGTVVIALGLIISAAVTAESQPGELQPALHSFNLDAPFERVRLIPNTRQALLLSGEGKQVARFNLDEGRLSKPCVLPRFGDVVIDKNRSFAYLVTTDREALPSILRLDLSKWDPLTRVEEGSCASSSIRLPEGVTNPLLALVGDDRLIVVERGSEVAFVKPVTAFDADSSPSNWERVEPIAVEPVYYKVVVAAVTGLPKEDMIFFSAPHAPEIHGLDIKTHKRWLLTALRQPNDSNRPLAMAIVAGREGKEAPPSAAVADQVSSRLVLFDYNASFRALDFVAEGAITVTDPGRQAPADGSTPLVVAASDGLSAIVVGSRQSKRLYFFGRLEDGVLQQLNVADRGPVMDLDVARDGSIAVILADNGRSLIRVDHPDTPDTSKPSQKRDEEVLNAQKVLAKLGYLIGAADGMLGPSTQNAISLFQRNQGLSPTGKLDPETNARLNDEQQRDWYRKRAEFERRFNEEFKEGPIRYFKVDDFLGDKTDTCTRSKDFPSVRTWCNAFALAKTMDAFKDRWGARVIIESAFRPHECGDSSGDASYSEFRALDFRSERGNPAQWIEVLERMRAEGLFEGRVEARGDRVHLELEPGPELWVSVGSRSKDGKFTSGFFDIAEPPEEGKGQVLKPNQPMQLRAIPPRLQGEKLPPIGYLEQNLGLTVERVVVVPDKDGEHYWAGGHIVSASAPDTYNQSWFVVIESYTNEPRAHLMAEHLRQAAQDQGFSADVSIDVYLSDNGMFAVVAGANLDQGVAKKLMLEARCAGLSDNAIMRPSKTWKKREPRRPDK